MRDEARMTLADLWIAPLVRGGLGLAAACASAQMAPATYLAWLRTQRRRAPKKQR